MSQDPPNPYLAGHVQEPVYQGNVVGPDGRPMYVQEEGDGTGGLIPYKNPKALLAYYLGIFALFPIIGIPLGIASITLGIMGLKERKRRPIIKGSVHAWIGIVLGTFSVVLYGLMVVAMVAALVAGKR